MFETFRASARIPQGYNISIFYLVSWLVFAPALGTGESWGHEAGLWRVLPFMDRRCSQWLQKTADSIEEGTCVNYIPCLDSPLSAI